MIHNSSLIAKIESSYQISDKLNVKDSILCRLFLNQIQTNCFSRTSNILAQIYKRPEICNRIFFFRFLRFTLIWVVIIILFAFLVDNCLFARFIEWGDHWESCWWSSYQLCHIIKISLNFEEELKEYRDYTRYITI